MHSIIDNPDADADELRTAYRNATETDAPDREDAVTVAYGPALAATLAANVAMTYSEDANGADPDHYTEFVDDHDDLGDGVAALTTIADAFATPEGEDRALTEIAEQVARDVVAEVEAATDADDPDAVNVADVDLTTFEAAATAELSTAPGNSTGGGRPSSNATTALNANSDGSGGPESVGTLADYRARSGETEGFGDPAGAARQGRKYARAEREIQQSLAEQTRTRTNSDDGDAERSAGTLADHRERQGRGDHTPAGRDNEGGSGGPGKLDGDRWDPAPGDDGGDDTAPSGTLAAYRNSRADRDDRPLRGVTVANGRVYAGRGDAKTTERPPDRLSRHGRVVEAGSREYVLRARRLRRDGKFPWKIPGEDDHDLLD